MTEKSPAPLKDKMIRRVCYTYNNYDESGLAILEQYENYRYHLAAYEVAPTTGTPHIQGYVCLKTRKRFSTLKKEFPSGVHFEMARGTTDENVKYIKGKENYKPFIEKGTPTSDNDPGPVYQVKEYLEQGLSMQELLEDPSFGVNSQTIKIYNSLTALYSPKRTEKPEVIWVYGKPGAGKTLWVHSQEGDNLYVFQLDKKWFDGYDKHEAILWDDFDLDIMKNEYDMTARDKLDQQRLLQRLYALCDRYEFRGNVKGSSVQIVAKRIYLVAHQPPWELWELRGVRTDKPGYYPTAEEIEQNSHLSQMMRRLTAIKHIKIPISHELDYPKVEEITHTGQESPCSSSKETVADSQTPEKPKKRLIVIKK